MILAGLPSGRHAMPALGLGVALAVGCSTRPAPRSEPGVRSALPSWVTEAVPESSDAGGGVARSDAARAVLDAGAGDAELRPDAAVWDAGRPACRDVLAGHLARVSCGGFRILVVRPIIAPPGRPVPPRATREVLDAVAALMRGHPELQLLRIEAYSSRDPGKSVRRVRRAIDASQARADAVFRYLWRHGKISPERLDPVGYGFRAAFRGARQRWPIVLSVVQRER